MVETRTGAHSSSMAHPQPANRVSVACENCHTRRCRCSGSSPCHACEESGLVCTFPPVRSRKPRAKPLPQATAPAPPNIPAPAPAYPLQDYDELIDQTSFYSPTVPSYRTMMRPDPAPSPAPTQFPFSDWPPYTPDPRFLASPAPTAHYQPGFDASWVDPNTNAPYAPDALTNHQLVGPGSPNLWIGQDASALASLAGIYQLSAQFPSALVVVMFPPPGPREQGFGGAHGGPS